MLLVPHIYHSYFKVTISQFVLGCIPIVILTINFVICYIGRPTDAHSWRHFKIGTSVRQDIPEEVRIRVSFGIHLTVGLRLFNSSIENTNKENNRHWWWGNLLFGSGAWNGRFQAFRHGYDHTSSHTIVSNWPRLSYGLVVYGHLISKKLTERLY